MASTFDEALSEVWQTLGLDLSVAPLMRISIKRAFDAPVVVRQDLRTTNVSVGNDSGWTEKTIRFLVVHDSPPQAIAGARAIFDALHKGKAAFSLDSGKVFGLKNLNGREPESKMIRTPGPENTCKYTCPSEFLFKISRP